VGGVGHGGEAQVAVPGEPGLDALQHAPARGRRQPAARGPQRRPVHGVGAEQAGLHVERQLRKLQVRVGDLPVGAGDAREERFA
jgi:hypothetical protein